LIEYYSQKLKINSSIAINELNGNDIFINSISLSKNNKLINFLDERGDRINVMNSDLSFLFFNELYNKSLLEKSLQILSLPFPAGLYTEIGIMISNPCFETNDEIQNRFNNSAYHGNKIIFYFPIGTVIWSWVNALGKNINKFSNYISKEAILLF
jgi:hypothetical protein